MRADLRTRHLPVARQRRHRADTVAGLQQVHGERMPQRAAGGGLGDARTRGRGRNLRWPASGFLSYVLVPGTATA